MSLMVVSKGTNEFTSGTFLCIAPTKEEESILLFLSEEKLSLSSELPECTSQPLASSPCQNLQLNPPPLTTFRWKTPPHDTIFINYQSLETLTLTEKIRKIVCIHV